MAKQMLIRAERDGFKSIDSSSFIFVLFVRIRECSLPSTPEFGGRIVVAFAGVQEWYRKHNQTCDFRFDLVLAKIHKGMLCKTLKTPIDRPCYFLLYCLGVSEDDIKEFWKSNGALESFKGTFFQKQVELAMQAMGKHQFENAKTYIPLSLLLQKDTRKKFKSAASARETMLALVSVTSPHIWDHPCTQDLFKIIYVVIYQQNFSASKHG